MKKNYKSTVNACFAGYVVQAIVNNFVPLLFLTFNKSYGIELSKITALITVNFILQLCIDLLSAFFIDKIGYRAAAKKSGSITEPTFIPSANAKGWGSAAARSRFSYWQPTWSRT